MMVMMKMFYIKIKKLQTHKRNKKINTVSKPYFKVICSLL